MAVLYGYKHWSKQYISMVYNVRIKKLQLEPRYDTEKTINKTVTIYNHSWAIN